MATYLVEDLLMKMEVIKVETWFKDKRNIKTIIHARKLETLQFHQFRLYILIFQVFVAGDFEEGDVVCTTWTWVYIGATCMIFLVFSILFVCVLCIYTNRRSADRDSKNRHYMSSAQHSIVNGITDRGVSTSTQGTFYQTQANYRNPHPPGIYN